MDFTSPVKQWIVVGMMINALLRISIYTLMNRWGHAAGGIPVLAYMMNITSWRGYVQFLCR